MSGNADWVVARPGGRVPEGLVARLRRDPAVAQASPLITTYVRIAGRPDEAFMLIGMDPMLDFPLRQWEVSASTSEDQKIWIDLIRKPNAILLSSPLAASYGVRPGDTLTLDHVHQVKTFEVVGILASQGLALMEGGLVSIADIATMQEFTGLQGWVDRIDLAVSSRARTVDLDRLRASLPPGIVLQAPTENKKVGLDLIRAYQLNLSLLSFVSLFVGMFLVYSLVSLNAASRRRELAILKALGASSRQVLILILSEGLLLGVTGWLLAVPVGAMLVNSMVHGVSNTVTNLFVRVHPEGLHLNGWEILLSFWVTVLISLVAASRPARETLHIAPKEALASRGTTAHTEPPKRHWVVMGMLLIVIAWPLSKLPDFPAVPISGYLAVLFLVMGFSLLSPFVFRRMGAFLSPFVRRVAGEGGFLGTRYVRDSGSRTAIAVGALVVAIALFVALTVMIHSFRHTVSLWVQQSIRGDFYVRPSMAGLNQYRDPMPEEVVLGLKELSDDVTLLPYRRIYLTYGKVPYQLESFDFDLFSRFGRVILMEGNSDRIPSQIMAGEGVLISEVFSNKTGLGVGDRFQVRIGEAVLDQPILGVFRDYRTHGGVVYMHLPIFQALTADHDWSGVIFFFPPGSRHLDQAVEALRARIMRSWGDRHPLEMTAGAALRKEIMRIFDETFAVTTLLLFIALLVAGLGIATTLTVLVLQRIREIHTLTAVGATSGQIRSMIFWEAIFMVAAGEVMGLVCGFGMAHLLIQVINLKSFGWTFLYRVDWEGLCVSLPLILAAALAAALPAARMILNLPPALVLREH
ncbi:MAG: ABC transporter permease [Deltaproteobacteria bacterium]|nr:ABC transporter permease [Deltaproteobacteria bacterium]